jgi:hypothetical protein
VIADWSIIVQCHLLVKHGFWRDHISDTMVKYNEEPEELIRYAALIHNSVMTATSTEQWKKSCLVNDAFGTTSWLFQDVSDVAFIVFHRVVRQRHLLRYFSRRFLIEVKLTRCVRTNPNADIHIPLFYCTVHLLWSTGIRNNLTYHIIVSYHYTAFWPYWVFAGGMESTTGYFPPVWDRHRRSGTRDHSF